MSYDEHLISMAGGDGEPDLDAIRARADAAVAGPWKAWDRGIGYEIHHAEDWAINDRHRETFTKADAEFIAHARTDVPALLALVRDQAAKLGRVEALALSLHDPSVIQHSFHIGSDPEHDAYKAEVAAAIRAAITATEGAA